MLGKVFFSKDVVLCIMFGKEFVFQEACVFASVSSKTDNVVGSWKSCSFMCMEPFF